MNLIIDKLFSRISKNRDFSAIKHEVLNESDMNMDSEDEQIKDNLGHIKKTASIISVDIYRLKVSRLLIIFPGFMLGSMSNNFSIAARTSNETGAKF